MVFGYFLVNLSLPVAHRQYVYVTRCRVRLTYRERIVHVRMKIVFSFLNIVDDITVLNVIYLLQCFKPSAALLRYTLCTCNLVRASRYHEAIKGMKCLGFNDCTFQVVVTAKLSRFVEANIGALVYTCIHAAMERCFFL